MRTSLRPLVLAALPALAALVAAPASAQEKPPAPAGAAGTAPAPDWVWPREIDVAGRRVHLFEPVVLSRDAATNQVALRFAARVTDALGRQTWGVADATGTARIDLASRLFLVDGIAAARSAFPQLPEKDRDQVVAAVPEKLPKEVLLRLDLLTAAPRTAPAPGEGNPAPPSKISMLAPEILVRTTPAVLVQIDGDPVTQPVAEFPLEYVVNTASDVIRDPKSGTWFLHVEDRWLESKAVAGPWKPLATALPIVLSQLPKDFARGHLRLFVPGTPESAARKAAAPQGPPPEVLVRDKPAELVLLRGEPLFTMIPGVKLLSVANTESDLFLHPRTGAYYLLVAGRWFTAEDVAGPWKEAFGGLPEEFARIPRDHVRGHVVWCVPGTPEAAEACAQAALEERITLQKATSLTVQYEGGAPSTVPLEGTAAKMVVNSDDDVFVADGSYWCCARGVWLVSDDGRSGWKPAAAVPATLASVPESSGAYHVRFCSALGPAEAGLRFGASGGYSGVHVVRGAPVHGTGHGRRGVLRGGNWYPYPRTYGENRWYDPLAGVFQPRTVRYDASLRAVADEWSPYTASYGRVRQYADRWGQGGRRMLPWAPERGRFESAAPRPDVYQLWGLSVKERDGLDAKRFPLGDRAAETSPAEGAVVADEAGAAWRLGAAGPETWKDEKWVAAEGCGAPERAWLDALARVNARPDQIRAWAAKRAAPLPVNHVK